ncbi:hypothetical protein OU790_08835 [Ruegeria sp. NA]|nr:hypothetical protein [Ruegeria sp. NA]MCX8953538.1 hypothetical protein [Ruegeria sp. NA]
MRFSFQTVLIAATVATTLAAGQTGTVFAEQAPMTADEKREKSRLSKAWNVSMARKSAEVRFTFSEKCEAAFEADEPMPEPDLRVTEEVEIDDDLMGMTVEQISEQYGLSSDAFDEADRAVKDCIRKFRKRNDGS